MYCNVVQIRINAKSIKYMWNKFRILVFIKLSNISYFPEIVYTMFSENVVYTIIISYDKKSEG